MTRQFGRTLLCLAMLATWAVTTVMPASASGVLYTQPFDGTGNAYASQNDTTGGNGNFSTMYDNFILGSNSNITSVNWTGEYFNPPSQGTITGWTLNIYANNAGAPGALLYTTGGVAGNGGETFLGTFAGTPTYAYGLNTAFSATAGTEYWMSVVPDLGFPPQWGWSSGTGGDGVSYQDFFGTRSPVSADMAFTLNGSVAAPEPSSVLLLATALAALGLIAHKKLA